jgi:hypothetical protein
MAVSLDEFKQFAEHLRTLRIANGLSVEALYKGNNAGISLVLRDGLLTASTAMVVFALDDPDMTWDRVLHRLADEVGAAWREVFLKNFKGDQYNNDGAPVRLVESMPTERVVRI